MGDAVTLDGKPPWLEQHHADSNRVPPADGLWDPRDVATYLKVSRSWVYRAAESGELPCLRIGGLVRFDSAAVRAWARGDGGKGA